MSTTFSANVQKRRPGERRTRTAPLELPPPPRARLRLTCRLPSSPRPPAAAPLPLTRSSSRCAARGRDSSPRPACTGASPLARQSTSRAAEGGTGLRRGERRIRFYAGNGPRTIPMAAETGGVLVVRVHASGMPEAGATVSLSGSEQAYATDASGEIPSRRRRASDRSQPRRKATFPTRRNAWRCRRSDRRPSQLSCGG